MGLSKPIFAAKAAPGTVLPKAIGNTYTASLYTSLASLLSEKGKTLVSDDSSFLISHFSFLISHTLFLKAKVLHRFGNEIAMVL